MRKYEIMYIINPKTTDEERTEVLAYVEKALAEIEATDVKSDTKMGERKLAYPIEKQATGYYVLTTFTVDGTKLGEVETKLNINEKVMRYILVKDEK